MPRDGAGNYTLPSGNPVVGGERISSTWANNTFEDVALAITQSLDRQGRGGMLAPFRFADGTVQAPGAAWSGEPSTGLHRDSLGDLRMSILGEEVTRWFQGAFSVWNDTDDVWEPVVVEADLDGKPYVRQGAEWVRGVPLNSQDGLPYLRADDEWVRGLPLNPQDGLSYLRVDEGWVPAVLVPAGSEAGQTLVWDDSGDGQWVSSGALSVGEDGVAVELDLDVGVDLSVEGDSTVGGDSTVVGKHKATTYEETSVLVDSASSVLDCSQANVFTVIPDDVKAFTFTNVPQTFACTVVLVQLNGGNNHTFTNVVWNENEAPDTPGNSKIAIYTFFTYDGGVKWFGSTAGVDFPA